MMERDFMKSCLIVVDYQNDFVTGALGFEKAKSLESIIINKIEKYLSANRDIIFTFDTHYDDYLTTQEGKRLNIPHCIAGSEGHQLYGKVSKYLNKDSIIFKKNTFGSLELGEYLKKMKYIEVEFVGLVTNMCILSNAVIAKAALPNSKIIVDSKACMSFDDEMHEKTLDILKGIHIDIL